MNHTATIEIDKEVYPLDIVKKAAYRFTDRVIVTFELEDKTIRCHFKPTGDPSKISIQKLVDEFQLELLDQDLRSKVFNETAPLRNAILALAFSKTTIQSNE